MSANIHLLRHLQMSVFKTGPLQITSCFKFEDVNQIMSGFRFEDVNEKLSALAHGTRHPFIQIYRYLTSFSDLSMLISNIEHPLFYVYISRSKALRHFCLINQ